LHHKESLQGKIHECEYPESVEAQVTDAGPPAGTDISDEEGSIIDSLSNWFSSLAGDVSGAVLGNIFGYESLDELLNSVFANIGDSILSFVSLLVSAAALLFNWAELLLLLLLLLSLPPLLLDKMVGGE